MTRTLLADFGLSSKFWVDTVLTAAFLINRFPSTKLNNASPYQVLYNTKPDYTHLKIFGCLCFPWLRPYIKHKLQIEVYHVFSLDMEVPLKVIVVLTPKQGVFTLRVMSSSMKTNFPSYNPLINIITHPRNLLLLHPL